MNRITRWLTRRALLLTIKRGRRLERHGVRLMAAVNVPQRVFSDGTTSRLAVYRVFGITALDTIQVSTEFANVISAFLIPTTGAIAAAAVPISSNTLLTPAGALAKDDGYLICFGAGIQQ